MFLGIFKAGALFQFASARASSLAALNCIINFFFFKDLQGVCQCLLQISSDSLRINEVVFLISVSPGRGGTLWLQLGAHLQVNFCERLICLQKAGLQWTEVGRRGASTPPREEHGSALQATGVSPASAAHTVLGHALFVGGVKSRPPRFGPSRVIGTFSASLWVDKFLTCSPVCNC